MRRKTLYLTVLLSLLSLLPGCCTSADRDVEESYTAFVDPFIGTGGHGHVFLGANVPFGMVQLGPSQEVKGWDWCSGYHYSDSIILGFSHVHLSGTGIGDLGDIMLLPLTDRADSLLAFSHDNEVCRPGYYKVLLDGSGIVAELTSTARTGFHRYTFSTGADTAFVRLNLNYGIGWDRPTETSVVIENDSTVSGYRYSRGWAPDHKIYFTAQFSRPFAGSDESDGLLTLSFKPQSDPLLIKVGLSAVSTANAKLNMQTENSGWDFDRTVREADRAWNDRLGQIKISTTDETDRRKFYTALYHTMFAPSIFSDVNGDYRGADGQVHNTGGNFTNYTIFSLWDTYRAAHPLSTLIHPELQADYANTFVNIYRQQGKLPVWHLHGNETNCMIGNPGVIVMGDLAMKGLVPDLPEAFEAMKASSLLDERSLDMLKTYGYVPHDAPGCEESVAKGLEYAIADAAVAKVASKLGREDDSRYFSDRANAYRHYFDSVSCFMRGKSTGGQFRDEVFNPFVTTHRADDYCEGNGWQYVWLVPHDPHGLIGLFGSEEKFVSRLDWLFTVEGNLGDGASPDISGMIGQYAHGNEPGHHTVYLYNYVGQPYKSAPILRRIMKELYNDGKDGLCGNEDVGQMSAWFVLSSMGLYQVEPVGGKFVLGSPLFDSAVIELGSGRSFEIRALNNSPENVYIQSVRLDGKPYEKSYIGFDSILEGGTLEFTMGPEPSATFGTSPDARP